MKTLRRLMRASVYQFCAMALGLVLLSAPASAQSVLAGSQTGTIQAEAQDDGYLTISGRNYTFSSDTQVFLNGQQISTGDLDEGMVVRYTLNNAGALTRIEILGPRNLIRALDPS